MINKDFVRKIVADIRSSVAEIHSFSSKPFDDLSNAERYAIRYNIIVLVEALTALAIHIARKAFGFEPETPVHA